MSRAVSIHIGVDAPRGRMSGRPLWQSERLAWQMACLAKQAGYESPLVLRGAAATCEAVHDALTAAAGPMTRGDILLISFAGHGCLKADVDRDERHGKDATWCLYDEEIVDDQLAGYWRLFAPGVRIVVVTDGCHTGGSAREDKEIKHPGYPARRAPRRMRGGSCIGAPPHDTDGIQASVLLLASAREDQQAREGLFTRHLLDEWKEGAFPGTFCELYWRVRERVMTERSCQEPQILMLGSPDPGFPLEPAFHLGRRSTHGPLSIGDLPDAASRVRLRGLRTD
jgi:hypothetical protein